MILDQQKLFHLLVVDDDRRLRGLLEKYLSDHGYLVSVAESAEEARRCLVNEQVDLVVLDVMMPGETGLEFAEKLRSDPSHPCRRIPILMLTALGDPSQRIEGLEKGADDYLTKPFEPRELLLRIQRILERHHEKDSNNSLISLGEYKFDVKARVLLHHGEVFLLTSAEQKLLEVLAARPRIGHSREELAACTGVPLSPRSIDVQVTRLRRKIGDDPRQPRYLRTIRHQGYALFPDE